MECGVKADQYRRKRDTVANTLVRGTAETGKKECSGSVGGARHRLRRRRRDCADTSYTVQFARRRKLGTRPACFRARLPRFRGRSYLSVS